MFIGVPSDRGQRHRKVGDLVEMLKQQSHKATAELADLVWRDDTARDGFREENGFVPLCKLLAAEGDLQREAARLLLNALFERMLPSSHQSSAYLFALFPPSFLLGVLRHSQSRGVPTCQGRTSAHRGPLAWQIRCTAAIGAIACCTRSSRLSHTAGHLRCEWHPYISASFICLEIVFHPYTPHRLDRHTTIRHWLSREACGCLGARQALLRRWCCCQ